jgi:hypothetical protein
MLGKTLSAALLLCAVAVAAPRQLTCSPLNHNLDNNDNFSRDDRYLCFDTRETLERGNGSSASILKVDVHTGAESIVYAPKPVLLDPVNAAPGVIAASFSPVADEVVFIHGPLVSETPKLGFYGKTNRRGAVAPADSTGRVRFLDARDVFSEVTPPGAHRGGTHRHEYSLDGRRIGFTYDDHLLPAYGRTVGMMMASPRAPLGVTHWTAILVPIVPQGTAKPGELESAAFDSWVGARGLMRAFIGRVKEADGTYRNSLFVADIPETVDITTSDSGTRTRYLAPPRGVTLRRLTHQEAWGIVRGSRDGRRIAYYASAADGTRQVFLIDSTGAGQPVQATAFPRGARSGLRWHPSGNSIAVLSDNGVAVVCVRPGPLFGKSYFLTPHGPSRPPLDALVWSNDGTLLAYNQRVPIRDSTGKSVRDAAGRDFQQIFLVDFPDANHNGIPDPIE